jgi:hypothetical protein
MTNPAPTDWRALCARMADELDYCQQLLKDDRRETHALATEARAALAQPELQELSDLRARIETLEAALHRHIMQTSSGTATSNVLSPSYLPPLTPEQVQNLQDLLGTYRNHLGLNN